MASQSTVDKNFGCGNLSTIDARCWRLLIWVMGLATPLLVSLKPRRFIVGEVDSAEIVGNLSQLTGRGLSLFFLMFACVVVLRHINRIDRKEVHVHARAFWLFTILLIAMPAISTIIAGDTLSPSGIFGTIIIYSATFFLPTPPLDWLIREVRIMLLAVFVYGSLLAAVLFPAWAWNLDYAAESTTAIIPLRLFGTTEHANALAPLTVFIWMLGRFPNCRLPREYLHSGAILLVLFLTQSKTNWAIVVILFSIYGFKRIASLSTWKKYLTFSAIGVTSVLGLLFLIKYPPFASRIEDMLYDPQVLTLTGRLPLWIVAVDMWLERPWLGQGLDAWSSKAVLDYISLLGWGATHAHNQLLQILSQSGLVGLGVFAIWAKYFMRIIRNAPVNIRTPFCWLILFFFLPGLTEVILQYGLGKASAIRAWILFVLGLLLLRTTTPMLRKE